MSPDDEGEPTLLEMWYERRRRDEEIAEREGFYEDDEEDRTAR